MHAAEELQALAASGALDEQLDLAALLVAAGVTGCTDVARSLGRLDRIAAAVPGPTLPALRHTLFAVLGFTGDTERYHELDNSLLDRVLRRRRGMPITLAVVTIAVGRRVGLELRPVAMPGHVLVKVGAGLWLDPFSGGRLLDQGGAEALFGRLQPPGTPFDRAYLEPVDGITIIARILANVAATAIATRDMATLVAAQDLRARLPDAGGLPAPAWLN